MQGKVSITSTTWRYRRRCCPSLSAPRTTWLSRAFQLPVGIDRRRVRSSRTCVFTNIITDKHRTKPRGRGKARWSRGYPRGRERITWANKSRWVNSAGKVVGGAGIPRLAKSNSRTPELNRTNGGRTNGDLESGRGMCRDKLARVTRSKVSGVSSEVREALCQRSASSRERERISAARREKYEGEIRILRVGRERSHVSLCDARRRSLCVLALSFFARFARHSFAFVSFVLVFYRKIQQEMKITEIAEVIAKKQI